MAKKDITDRRIYVLPAELVERIRAYQAEQNLPSEVEAVRRLLDSALELRDSPETLLKKIQQKMKHEKDIRVLAKEILAGHSQISSVFFESTSVWFIMTNRSAGKVTNKGEFFTGDANDENYVHRWQDWPEKPKQEHGWGSKTWSKKSDLDDDIPF